MRRLMVAAGAVAALTVAGCGTTAAPSLGNVRLSAAEVMQQTAQKADDVTSYTADLVMDVSGPHDTAGTVQGTMLYQKTPQLASDIRLDEVKMDGRTLPGGLRMILHGDVAYLKVDAVKDVLGATKPWVKVDLKQLGSKNGAYTDQFLAQAQQVDLKDSVALLTASKDVKPVGTETVGGVATTHYSGTFPVDEAVKQLPAQDRARVESQLAKAAKNVKFDAWIDGQQLPRKIQLNGSAPEQGQGSFTATMMFKAFNEPVTIQTPPAEQVGDLSQLRGAAH